MSSVRHVDPGIMCNHAEDGALACFVTVYASQVAVADMNMAKLVRHLRTKGWSINIRRGPDAYDLCPKHSGIPPREST